MALRHDPPPTGPGPASPWPAVDARLVVPERREEMLEGKLIYSPPAEEPHGHQHWKIPSVLGLLLADGYEGAVDMLTRASGESDFASDASVYPAARDPVTGGRRLEELAFEIASDQPLSIPTTKARQLVRRGVRRVFLIRVLEGEVFEWSEAEDGWLPLAPESQIEDRCFRLPVPVLSLLDRAMGDETLIRAALARASHPAVIEIRSLWEREGRREGRKEGRKEGHKEGRKEGREEGVREGLRLAVARSPRARDRAARAARPHARGLRGHGALLAAWLDRALVAGSAEEVFGPR